jgi:hypothetical protein
MAGSLLIAALYQALAGAVLVIHLVWILWVILGALLTRRRPWLVGFHILSLVYGVVIEVVPWPCPLTLAEQWLEQRAGITPYSGSFLVHYLDALVYPDVSLVALVCGASAVAAFNFAIYGRRFWKNRFYGWK